jgi:hypothetical protein
MQASTLIYPQDSVSVANLFPHFVTAEDTNLLDSPCMLQEVLGALNSFNKDRSPGPDGWTVEFFLHFFDLVGTDLLDLVEDSRLRGRIIGALNSTFLTLIPKENNPSTFGDYRLIALCNLCYKLITKIIANRIKPILSRTLSGEQLGFFKRKTDFRCHWHNTGVPTQHQGEKIKGSHTKIRSEKSL